MVGYAEVVRDFDLKLAQGIGQAQDEDAGFSAQPLLLEGDVREQREQGFELLAGQAVDLLVGFDERAAVEAGGEPLLALGGADEHEQFFEVARALFFEVGRPGCVGA